MKKVASYAETESAIDDSEAFQAWARECDDIRHNNEMLNEDGFGQPMPPPPKIGDWPSLARLMFDNLRAEKKISEAAKQGKLLLQEDKERLETKLEQTRLDLDNSLSANADLLAKAESLLREKRATEDALAVQTAETASEKRSRFELQKQFESVRSQLDEANFKLRSQEMLTARIMGYIEGIEASQPTPTETVVKERVPVSERFAPDYRAGLNPYPGKGFR